MHIVAGISVEKTTSPEELISILLSKRKIADSDSFLHPPHPLTFSLTMLGFDRELKTLLSLLRDCKENNKNIVIYTDYDADGITGGSLLWETLYTLGFKSFPYVPHRQREGYGFSLKGLDAIIEQYNPGLIISVDHGISAREQIQYASDKGVSVVVTDHHTKPELLPNSAKAIIHCPLVSGSGLAYITALTLWREINPQNKTLERLFTYDYLALAALGTIADLVPLTGYSRSIAKYGLQAFSHATKPGIKELLAVAGLSNTEISTYHAGFALAPRINAVGRLSHAIEAVRMLCTKDGAKAQLLAHKAQVHNTTRQRMVDVAIEEAFIAIANAPIPRLILLKSTEWNEGIIGLISSKISERYRRPSVVMTKIEGGWKGSARSIKGFNITEFLRSLEVLKHVGGHPQAAGFSLSENVVSTFEKRIEQTMSKIPEPQEKEIAVDINLPITCISEKLADALDQLTPFGIGNPTPLFQSNVKILFIKSMGKKQEHLKFVCHDIFEKTKQIECVYFSPSAKQKILLIAGHIYSMVYTVEAQYWQGKRQLKCFVKVVQEVI